MLLAGPNARPPEHCATPRPGTASPRHSRAGLMLACGPVLSMRSAGGDDRDVRELLNEAIAELYGADPETFTATRKELAAKARREGDTAAAKSIAALGKPTKSAWLVNKLVRDDPTVPGRLAELGDQLRAGEAALDGATIRRLSVARRELIDSLVRQALGPDAPAALREEVTGTLNAALADPEVARQVAAGTVVRAATWAGFSPGIGTGAAAWPLVTPSQASAVASRPNKSSAGQEQRKRQAAATAAEATRAAEAAAAAQGERQQDVKLAEQQLHDNQDKLAQAEHAAVDAQQRLAEAQRALAEARQRQAEAGQRLTTTRKTLAQARKHLAEADAVLRQAKAEQRKAAEAVDRLADG